MNLILNNLKKMKYQNKQKSFLHPNRIVNSIISYKDKNIFNELTRNNVCKRSGIIFVKEENNNKYILVVQGSYSGIWSLPKGKINDGETDEECACREVWEETGIIMNPDFIRQLPKIKIDHNIYFIYNLDLLGKNIQDFHYSINDKNEISDIQWKSFDELSSISINKDIRNILTQTLIYY